MPGFPRNSSNLPVEVLRMIFTCRAKLHDRPISHSYSFPSWISITHVCRQWRAVALNHHSLWVSITSEYGLGWIKASIERSEPFPIDVSLFTGGAPPKYVSSSPKMIVLLTLIRNCMRLGSLYVSGQSRHFVEILKALGPQTSIHTLSLFSIFNNTPTDLPVSMFGGQALIRTLSLNSDSYFVAPHWSLHGVTRFSCHQQVPLQALLDTLREMPRLQFFELRHCKLPWEDTDTQSSPPIQMPNLMDFSVHADSLRFFTLLNERLALPEGSKRKSVLMYQAASDLDSWVTWTPRLLTGIPAANRLTHIRLSGGSMEGTLCIWVGGPSMTDCEDAVFSFSVGCTGRVRQGPDGKRQLPIVHLASLCDLLGAATTRTLILDPGQDYCDRYKKLSRSALWAFLGRLIAVEELELHVGGAEVLWNAWKVNGAPVVMPALRSIRMVRAGSTVPRVSKITEEGLLRLLHGGGTGRRRPRSYRV